MADPLQLLVGAVADAVAARLSQAPRPDDPTWGKVSQDTLPPWIHPKAYVEACRAGRIAGARRGSVADPGRPRRQIRAPRASHRVAPLDRGDPPATARVPRRRHTRRLARQRLRRETAGKQAVREKNAGRGRKSTAGVCEGLASRNNARYQWGVSSAPDARRTKGRPP